MGEVESSCCGSAPKGGGSTGPYVWLSVAALGVTYDGGGIHGPITGWGGGMVVGATTGVAESAFLEFEGRTGPIAVLDSSSSLSPAPDSLAASPGGREGPIETECDILQKDLRVKGHEPAFYRPFTQERELSDMSRVQRGLFAVWKPPDVLSASVVQTIKNILEGQKVQGSRRVAGKGSLKVGHGGTLDKFSEGVLVIGVGRDCKKLGLYTTASTKGYEVTCELGRLTDTLDVNGVVVEVAPWDHVGRGDLEKALDAFRGDITQTPPLFSALKFQGVRFSDLAMKAREENVAMPAAPKPRTVTIHSLELLRFDPPHFTVAATCSSGTYMRSLARDISAAVGSVGHAVSLTRKQQGQFTGDMALRESNWTVEGISHAIGLVDRMQLRCNH